MKITNLFTFTTELEILHFVCEQQRNLSILDKHPLIKKLFILYNTPLPFREIIFMMLQ